MTLYPRIKPSTTPWKEGDNNNPLALTVPEQYHTETMSEIVTVT